MIVNGNLISGIKKGNQSDFKRLYDAYSTKIFKVSKQFGLRDEDAKEIVQEVFLRVWVKRARLQPNLSLHAYLLTITKNLLIKRYRKNTYELIYKRYLKVGNHFFSNNTEDDIIYSDLTNLTQGYIDELPLQQREIFLLSRKSNLSNKEIAEKLKISLRTVENQLYRATKKIKKQLQDEDVLFILALIGHFSAL